MVSGAIVGVAAVIILIILIYIIIVYARFRRDPLTGVTGVTGSIGPTGVTGITGPPSTIGSWATVNFSGSVSSGLLVPTLNLTQTSPGDENVFTIVNTNTLVITNPGPEANFLIQGYADLISNQVADTTTSYTFNVNYATLGPTGSFPILSVTNDNSTANLTAPIMTVISVSAQSSLSIQFNLTYNTTATPTPGTFAISYLTITQLGGT